MPSPSLQISFACEYCNNFLSSRSALNYHKKTSKNCIKIRQNQSEISITTTISSNCNFCKKEFTTKGNLNSHLITCVEKRIFELNHDKDKIIDDKDKIIDDKDKYIEQLLLQLKEKDLIIKDLAEKAISNAKPTTINNTTNNVINNLQIISEDLIKEQAKHLTLEHIKKGALGYSEYFLEYPLKERIVCTDYARRKIKYKNEKGEIVIDPEMTTLSDLLFKSIKDRNRELTIQYTNELTDKFKTATDPTQLSYFMEVAGKFSDQDIEVFKMFNGNKNDFFHDILRNICSKTVASA